MTALLAALVVLEALALIWLAWPDSYEARHLTGRNPAADDLQRAMTADKRDLRRSPAPWSHPTTHRQGDP